MYPAELLQAFQSFWIFLKPSLSIRTPKSLSKFVDIPPAFCNLQPAELLQAFLSLWIFLQPSLSSRTPSNLSTFVDIFPAFFSQHNFLQPFKVCVYFSSLLYPAALLQAFLRMWIFLQPSLSIRTPKSLSKFVDIYPAFCSHQNFIQPVNFP